MRKDEFMKQIRDCESPAQFDQHLLDHAAQMFGAWGKTHHRGGEEEHLFQRFGLNDEAGESEAVKREKAALRCILMRMMKMQISREDAAEIMRNFNKINEPGVKVRWEE